MMTVQTRDMFGNPHNVTAPTTLNLSSTSAQGYFSEAIDPWANTTSVTISSGQSSASFYYKDTLAGAPTITASEYPDQGWSDASQQETINPAGHAAYTVVPAAYTQTAGVAFNVTITAVDQFGNTATGIDATLNGYDFIFSGPSDSPDNSTPAYPAAPSFSGGVWTDSVTLVCAETVALMVTDNQATPMSGTCAPITLAPASASKLEVTGIADPADAGTAFDVVVTALDPYGNVDTSYTGTIRFTSSDDRAELPPDYTFAAADNGTHIFIGGVILKRSGEQWVKATDIVTATVTGDQTEITVSGVGGANRATIIGGLVGGVVVIGGAIAYLVWRRKLV